MQLVTKSRRALASVRAQEGTGVQGTALLWCKPSTRFSLSWRKLVPPSAWILNKALLLQGDSSLVMASWSVYWACAMNKIQSPVYLLSQIFKYSFSWKLKSLKMAAILYWTMLSSYLQFLLTFCFSPLTSLNSAPFDVSSSAVLTTHQPAFLTGTEVLGTCTVASTGCAAQSASLTVWVACVSRSQKSGDDVWSPQHLALTQKRVGFLFEMYGIDLQARSS